MTHASLFSGIGGFDYAAALLGWINIFDCEIDAFCRKVLEYHFPNSVHYGDITKQIFKEWRGKIDVLSGGFPCQPFSLAGQRKGADDNRYLWPEMLRVIREIRPTWVVGENVAGILTMVQPGAEVEVGGQASLFGEDYRKRVLHRQEYVIETICRDLEHEGYAVQPLLIPACAVGAPHRRDRVWFVAHRTDAGAETMQCGRKDGVCATEVASDAECKRSGQIYEKVQPRQPNGERAYSYGGKRDASNAHCERHFFRDAERPQGWKEPDGRVETLCGPSAWTDFPTQSPVRSGDDGISGGLDGITFSKWRQESVKAYGNAIVPQVAYEIFKTIELCR